MELTALLKIEAQKIIELSEQLAARVHTWNQEDFAPTNGYKDRAGFVIFDDIELFADIFASEDDPESKLRVRLAWAPKDEDQELFTIITLDFEPNMAKAKDLIGKADDLTREEIIELLHDAETKPSLVHVSFESGTDSGKRYEYRDETIENITNEEKSEFIQTLNKAYDFITARI